MKKILLISLLVGGLCPVDLRAQQSPKSFAIDEFPFSIGYLEYLPPNYKTEDRKFPVLIYLHGSGEAGTGTPEELVRVLSWGPPKEITKGHDMCFTVNGEKECFIVISPQFGNVDTWRYFVPHLFDHLLTGPDKYKIDRSRIYLTGLSRGGNAVYTFASGHNNTINKLAAIAPIAARFESDVDACVISTRKIPLWAFHGELDTVVPYNFGLLAFNAIKQCPNSSPETEMIFTSYPDRYHDSWIPAYDPSHMYHSPNLYEWLLQQSLDTTNIITGVEVNSEDDAPTFTLYPNPSGSGSIHISLKNTPIANSDIEIYTLTGQLMMRIEHNTNMIDTSGLEAGVYVVKVTSESGAIARERLVRVN